MKKWIIVFLLLAAASAMADEYLPSAGKYKTCENEEGRGFYWVDSSTGRTWRADPDKKEFVYCGQPPQGTPSEPGTYKPYKNKDGKGLFILNTATGDGWWTDGKEWEKMPKDLKKTERGGKDG